MTSRAGFTVKWLRKNRLKSLLRDFKQMDGAETRIGYFPSSGTHPRFKKSYATLMGLHELRPVSDPMYRPVFGKSLEKGGKDFEDKFLREVAAGILRSAKGGSFPINRIMHNIGKDGVKMIKPTFGDKTLLKPNAPLTVALKGKDTPLVEYGDLRNALEYKVK